MIIISLIKKKFILFIVSLNIFTVFSQDFIFYKSLKDVDSQVTFLTLRSEDNLLINGYQNGQINIWNTETGELLKSIKQHTDKISHIAVSNNGNYFASGSYDGKVIIFDMNSYQKIKEIKNPSILPYNNIKGKEITFLVFSSDDKYIYFGGYNMKVLKSKISENNIEEIFSHKKGGITCGIMSPDKKYLVIASLSDIYFIDLRREKIKKKFHKSNNYDDFVCELLFYKDKKLLISWNYNGNMVFWNHKNKQIDYEIKGTNEKGSSNLSISPDEKYLLTGNDINNINIWNLKDRQITKILKKHTSSVTNFAYSEDNEYIVTGSKDFTIYIWKKENVEIEETDIPNKLNNRRVIIKEKIKINSNDIEISLWDNMIEDGDTISLNLNGKWILNNYRLKKGKKSIKFSSDKKNNYLIMHAHNEGSKSPNTAAIKFKAGNFEKIFFLKSTKKKSSAINIIIEN